MCLIQGLMGKKPCPRCLVPREELSNLLQVHPLQMAQGTSETILYTNAQSTAEKTEEILKGHGLQNISVQSTSVYFKKKILMAWLIFTSRMHSLKYGILTFIVQYHGIVCILTMVGLVVTILSLKLSTTWEIWVRQFVKKSTNSALASYSYGLIY